MRDGRPTEPALRLERVTLDELLESARDQGIANLRDVEPAILEPSGKFTFLQRKDGGDEQPAAPEEHKA